MGPTLGSAGSLETLVADGEARFKRQGDVAVDNLFTEEKHATARLDGKTYAFEENVSKMAKEFEEQSIQMEIQVQRAMESRGLESLKGMSTMINTAIEAEIPKVFVDIHKKFTKNPEVFFDRQGDGGYLCASGGA